MPYASHLVHSHRPTCTMKVGDHTTLQCHHKKYLYSPPGRIGNWPLQKVFLPEQRGKKPAKLWFLPVT